MLMLPLLASAQAPTSDSVAFSGSTPTTPSNYRKTGTNASNYRLQYLGLPNKMIELVTGYQFNNYIGTATQTALSGKASNALVNSKADSARLYGTVLPTYSQKSDFSSSSDKTKKYVFSGMTKQDTIVGLNAYEANIRWFNGKLNRVYTGSLMNGENSSAIGNGIYVDESNDNGITWVNQRRIHTNPGFFCEVPSWVVGSGIVGVIFKEGISNSYTTGGTRYIYSTNGLVTWSSPSTITMNDGSVAVPYGNAVIMGDGKTHILLHNQNRAEDITTTDFINWTYHAPIQTAQIGSTITIEHTITYIGNNKAIITARNNNLVGGGTHPMQWVSNDNLNTVTYKGFTNINGTVDTAYTSFSPVAMIADTVRGIVFTASSTRRFAISGLQPDSTMFYISDATSVFNDPKAYQLRFKMPRPLTTGNPFNKGYDALTFIGSGFDNIIVTKTEATTNWGVTPTLTERVNSQYQYYVNYNESPFLTKNVQRNINGLVPTSNVYTGNIDYIKPIAHSMRDRLGYDVDKPNGIRVFSADSYLPAGSITHQFFDRNGNRTLYLNSGGARQAVFNTKVSVINGFGADINGRANLTGGLNVSTGVANILSNVANGLRVYGTADTLTNTLKLQLSGSGSAMNIGATNTGTVTASTLNLSANNGSVTYSINGTNARHQASYASTAGGTQGYLYNGAFSGANIRQTHIIDSLVSTKSGTSGGYTIHRFGSNIAGQSGTTTNYLWTGGPSGTTTAYAKEDGTLRSATITTNRAVVSNSSNELVASAVTATELGYLSGVTSAIQTQLNSKVNVSDTASLVLSKANANTNYVRYQATKALNMAGFNLTGVGSLNFQNGYYWSSAGIFNLYPYMIDATNPSSHIDQRYYGIGGVSQLYINRFITTHGNRQWIWGKPTETYFSIDSARAAFKGKTLLTDSLGDLRYPSLTESTWAPIASATVTSATGRYTKMGNTVMARFSITVDVNASSTPFTISGLPVANSTNSRGSITISFTDVGLPILGGVGLGSSAAAFFDFSGVSITCAQMSGKTISGTIQYNTTN